MFRAYARASRQSTPRLQQRGGVGMFKNSIPSLSLGTKKKLEKTKNENELRLKYMGALRYIVTRMNAVAKGRL